MNRNASITLFANITQYQANLTAAAASLGLVGSAATQMGQRLAQGMNAATASVRTFATQSQASLTNFYTNQDRQQRAFSQGWGRLGDDLTSIGQKLTVGLTGSIALLGATSFKSYAEIDSLKRGLTAVMGSASLAANEFKNLRVVAALPGLGLKESVQGSVRLQAVGFSADKARQALLQFGNAIALTGGGKSELNSVTVQLGQLAAKGKVLSQDLRPIIEAAPAIAPALQRIFNSVDPEEISAKLKAAGKDSKYFVDVLVAELSKLERVSGGPKNAIENLGDSLTIARYNFVSAADKALNLTSSLNGLGNFVTNLSTSFAALNPQTQGAIFFFTGLAAAVGPAALGIGTIIRLLPVLATGFGALLSPIAGVVALLSGLAIATYSVVKFNSAVESSYKSSKLLSEANASVAQSVSAETGRLSALLAVARDETQSKESRRKAIADINAISPQYLSNITQENINLRSTTQAVQDYTRAIQLKAQADLYNTRLAETRGQIAQEKAVPLSDRTGMLDTFGANISSIGAYFGKYDEAEKKLHDKQSQRQNQTLSDLKKQETFYQRNLDLTIRQQSEMSKGKPLPATPNFKALGGESELQKLQDHYKSLKAEASSFLTKHQQVPKAIADDLKATATEIKSVQDNIKKLSGTYKEPGAKFTRTATPQQTGDLAIAKRFESQLETQIQNAGGKNVDEKIRQLKDVRSLIESLQSLTSKDQRLSISGIKEITDPNATARVKEIVDNFHDIARTSPTIFNGNQAKDFFSAFTLAKPSVEAYQNGLESIKSIIATMGLNGLTVPQKAIDTLEVYTQKTRDSQKAVEQAQAAAENQRLSKLPKLGAIKIGGFDLSLFNDSADTLVARTEQLGQSMSGALQNAAAGVASGMGELIGGLIAGTASLSQIPGMIGSIFANLAKTMGESMIAFGTAGLAAKAFLSNPVTAIIGGVALIALGSALQGLMAQQSSAAFAKPMETGGLFTGESVIRVAESHKARKGGGEWVTPVDKGAELVAGQLMKMGIMDSQNANSGSSTQNLTPNSTRVLVDVGGKLRLEGSDLVLSYDRTKKGQKTFGNGR